MSGSAPSSLPTVNSSRWTYVALHITDSTDQRNILWHYMRERTFQGAYRLIVGNHTVIWLVCAWACINKEAACAWDTCRDASLLAAWLETSEQSGNSGTQIKVGMGHLQVTLVSITSPPFMHKYPGLPAGPPGQRMDRFGFLSVCQVLRALVRPVLLCSV